MIDSDYALRLARRHLPRAQAVTAVFEQGWRHLVFEIDGEHVLKVRSPSAPGGEVERDAAVLAYLEETSAIRVPRVVAVDQDPVAGTYSCMTRLPGISLGDKGRPRAPAAVQAVGRAVAQLHSVPVGPLAASGHVPVLDLDAVWQLGLRWLRERREIDALGEAVLERRYQLGREQLAEDPPVLLHGDLWPPACFFARDSHDFLGFIDFGDASIGPAAWEFSLNQLQRGEWPDELLAAYARVVPVTPRFEAEVEFYRMVNTVHFLAWMEPWAPQPARPSVYRNVLEAIRRYVSAG